MNKQEIKDKLKQMEQEMADLLKKLDEPELLPCPFCEGQYVGGQYIHDAPRLYLPPTSELVVLSRNGCIG